jgi:predicted thioesterase
MRHNIPLGERLQTTFVVGPEDTASFGGVEVHPVCSTFAMAREAEWACRQFVLKLREDHEEGIGNGLTIEHKAPALIGQRVDVIATLESCSGNDVLCSWEALASGRLLATGTCSQKVLDRGFLQQRFDRLRDSL